MKKGVILDISGYGRKSKVSSRVIGVLNNSTEFRRELLSRNLGEHPLSQNAGGDKAGALAEVYGGDDSVHRLVDKQGLIYETHSNSSDLGEHINGNYGFGEGMETYSTPPIANAKSRWSEGERSYLEYLSKVYGYETSPLNFIASAVRPDMMHNLGDYDEGKNLSGREILNGFLSNNSMAHVLELDQIGAVRDIDPVGSLSGWVATNINNYSGKDTPLGLMSNHLYASALVDSARVNSLRTGRHISPELTPIFGLRLESLHEAPFRWRVDKLTGRIGDTAVLPQYMQTRNADDMFESMEDMQSKSGFDEYKTVFNSQTARYASILKNDHSGLESGGYTPFRPYDGSVDMNTVTAPYMQTTIPSISYFHWSEKHRGDESYANTDSVEFSFDEKASMESAASGLIRKTKSLLDSYDSKDAIDTVIGRFHTEGTRDKEHNVSGALQTAITSFGMSHGRNLLTEKAYNTGIAEKTNGYSNPYCRVWTYHHQYDRLSRTIRPIDMENLPGRTQGGQRRLAENSVIQPNGMVRIAPTDKSNVKKCMFSLENLAWKDVLKDSLVNKKYNGGDAPDGPTSSPVLEPSQIGPMGGRIMWFPPYDLKFNEQVQAEWESSDFIGRGEKIYTYKNTSRGGTLSFSIVVDHPSVIDYWISGSEKASDFNIESNEQELLRFFAGCDTLDVDGRVFRKADDGEGPEIGKPVETIAEESADTATRYDDIVFYVFFPNNYSGKGHDDFADYIYESEYEMGNMGCKKIENGYKNTKWMHRVDDKYLEQILSEDCNYSDNMGFCLNSDIGTVRKNADFDDATITFKDVYEKKGDIVKSGFEVCGMKISGYASSHGYKEENNGSLSASRKLSVKKWIMDIIENVRSRELTVLEGNNGEIGVNREDRNNASGQSAKRGRFAKVVLSIRPRLLSTPEKEETESFLPDISPETDRVISASYAEKGKEEGRYMGEERFFEMLPEKDPVLFRKISDKIRFFDPAFHAITPEGFNARLTFLHQCTRQGNTTGKSDGVFSSKMAGNLAFGRPPVCVLRLGDFYNTKIVITSLLISFDDTTWDFNTEGIGMQPMIAKISLNFNFLGGSDIEAPITKLQNAISFNYYANTSIYDDRSDTARISNGSSQIASEFVYYDNKADKNQ